MSAKRVPHGQKRNDCYHHQHPADGGPPKRPFPTRRKAESAIYQTRRYGERRERTPCRAYQCPGCKRWFLTSKE